MTAISRAATACATTLVFWPEGAVDASCYPYDAEKADEGNYNLLNIHLIAYIF